MDAEKLKSNRRGRILFILMAHLPQPSLDAVAVSRRVFCNSPATITKSVKYGTAVNIDIEKTSKHRNLVYVIWIHRLLVVRTDLEYLYNCSITDCYAQAPSCIYGSSIALC